MWQDIGILILKILIPTPESSDRVSLADAAFDRMVGFFSCRQPVEDR
jgi:hypothetical protein